MTSPKVFISYSWNIQEIAIEIANRLLSDGVSVVIDVYDLKEGDDKNAFMETMVTDESITHVLTLSDRQYAEKANERKSGVGTESQIISAEVYPQIKQSKFIPIVLEFNDENQPFSCQSLLSDQWI